MHSNAAEFDRVFTSDHGRRFTVRYVAPGAPRYSAPGTQTPARTAVIEFYDATPIGTPAEGHPAGLYTGASHPVETVLGPDGTGTGALALAPGIDAWTIDAQTMAEIRVWVAGHGEPSPAKARILEGHRVSGPDTRALRHHERYGAAAAFRPYTGPGIGGGWYAKTGIADCGHEYSNLNSDGSAGISTGYAVDPDTDRSYCFDCVTARTAAELDALTHDTGPVFAYVAGDGSALTTWPGGELARVIGHRPGHRNHWWQFQRGERLFFGVNAGPGTVVAVHAYKPRTATDTA